ncbi:hypothetical protein Tco_1123588 [Tanacetum coccineum]|uniref:Uncharacterized protein n=1 Tax=Tanacetum coccineum TaxID=301880 RepID=A0ABQ5J6P9_9ASTR
MNLKYGNHETMNKNVKKGVIGTWLIKSYKLQFEEYLEIKRQRETHAQEVDMEYNPSNLVLDEWLASKFYNHLEMDWYTKNALWVYWMRGNDEVVLSNREVSDLKDEINNDEHEIAEVFRIETNLFDYETPLCAKFNEFNYLLKADNRLWEEPTPVEHYYVPFSFKSGHSEWPTCSWKDDGYCNGGNLPGAFRVGNMLRYQDLEWYEALEDGKLKDEALQNKAIMERVININKESCDKSWRRWDDYENTIHNYEEREPKDGHSIDNLDYDLVRDNASTHTNNKEEEHKERCNLFDNTTRDAPVCKIRRFEMIKYSFGHDEEYVAIKECEYDDMKKTNEDACRAYQEIFRSMDEGWDLAGKKLTTLVKYQSSGILAH